MPSYIKKDFEPDQDTINALHKEGIFQDFLNHILPDFKEYWEDLAKQKKAKGKKESWQRTFRTWARRSFHGKQGREYEENRHKGRTYGGQRNDLFDKILDRLDPTPKSVPCTTDDRPKYYRLPDPPQPGPAMSPDEAFAALRIPRQGNIFEEALAGVYAQDLPAPERPRRVYRSYEPPPESTETMSEADALDALAKFRKRAGHR